MRPETLALLRSNRPAQAALAASALVALVVVARLVDVHSVKPVITSRSVAAAAAAPRTQPLKDLALGPNETLVTATPAPSGPLMPHYAPPPAPSAADAVPDQPQAPQEVLAEGRAALAGQQAARTEPVAPAVLAPVPPVEIVQPQYRPAEMVAPLPRSYCPRCGEVVGITHWPDMTEVRVQFEDGSTHTMRGPAPSRWRVGDHVRAEGGRLVGD